MASLSQFTIYVSFQNFSWMFILKFLLKGCLFVYFSVFPNNQKTILQQKMSKHFLSGSCGQSHKHFTLVNYGSRVIITKKLLIFTTLES